VSAIAKACEREIQLFRRFQGNGGKERRSVEREVQTLITVTKLQLHWASKAVTRVISYELLWLVHSEIESIEQNLNVL
jgi:hypothetical protein